MFCPNCGKEETNPEVKFCSECGEKFDDNSKVATPENNNERKEVKYCGFWIRFVAVIIDGILLLIVNSIISAVIGSFIGMFVGIAVAIAYQLYFLTSDFMATPGKIALGMIVVDTDYNRLTIGKALLRYIGYWISAIILCIGFIMVGFTAKKQGLHDMIAGTYVIKK